MEPNQVETFRDPTTFLNSLPRTLFSYKDVLIVYSELVSDGIVNSKESHDHSILHSEKNLSNVKRPGTPWTQEEVDAIKDGLEKYGIGKWAKILELHKDIFAKNDRRSGDLGDKWKNLKNKPEFRKFFDEKPKEQEIVKQEASDVPLNRA